LSLNLGPCRVDEVHGYSDQEINVHHARIILMDKPSRTPLSLALLLCLGELILMSLVSTVGSAQPSQPGIHVEILGIRNSIGAVACALFEAPEGFPTEFLRFTVSDSDQPAHSPFIHT
jgi:hypothetical protein